MAETSTVRYVETIFVRSKSGHVHEVYRIKGRRVSDERCNLDDADLEVLTEAQFSELDASAMCGHCFPTQTA